MKNRLHKNYVNIEKKIRTLRLGVKLSKTSPSEKYIHKSLPYKATMKNDQLCQHLQTILTKCHQKQHSIWASELVSNVNIRIRKSLSECPNIYIMQL